MITNYIDPTAITAELRKLVLATLFARLIVLLADTSIRNNPLSFVGRTGYSVYAFHAPFAVFFCVIGFPWWLNFCAVMAIGMSIYFAVERPLDLVGKSFAAKSHWAARSESG